MALTEEQKKKILRTSQPLSWGDTQENNELIELIEAIIAKEREEAESRAVEKTVREVVVICNTATVEFLDEKGRTTEIHRNYQKIGRDTVEWYKGKSKELSQPQEEVKYFTNCCHIEVGNGNGKIVRCPECKEIAGLETEQISNITDK